jgi:hypothetical protein
MMRRRPHHDKRGKDATEEVDTPPVAVPAFVGEGGDDEPTASPFFSGARSDEGKRRKPRFCKCCSLWCCCIGTTVTLVVGIVVFALTVWIGSDMEWRAVVAKGNTKNFYTMDEVCAAPAGSNSYTTYNNVEAAHANDGLVRHCGDCGDCSSARDIDILDVTKNSLTKTATRCAVQKFFGGRAAVERCFDSDVGFTPPCTTCWVDNVMCTQNACVFNCLRSLILRESNNAESGDLNRCLECDEKMCGPAFILCAGANRRRSGIVSDIGRDNLAEVCKKVDEDWAVGVETG